MITNIVDQCKKQYVPKMRKKRKKKKHSWMDNRAHKAQKRKHKSYDIQKRESSDKNREDYKKVLNIFTREARRSKEKFERKMAENIKHDQKSFFHMRDQNHELSIVWHPLWMEMELSPQTIVKNL